MDKNISVSSFFSDTLSMVDSVIGDFVKAAYVGLVQNNEALIISLLTVYIMVLGYRFITRSQSADLMSISKNMVLILCVYGLVMNWELYNIFIYNIFTNEPQNIAQILIHSAGNIHFGNNIISALDEIYEIVISTSINFFNQTNFSFNGVVFIFYGSLVFIIGMILCVFSLLLFIYSKMMMAISLALGPIFILFFLWDSTKGIFTAWIKKLFTLALIPIITSVILVLMLSIINTTLPNATQSIESLRFYGIAPFLTLNLATALILSQVFKIASSLGGSITLASLSKGVDIAKSSFGISGITSTSRRVANWSKSKVNNFTRNK